jgi:predicted amidophosphoribosyltransferase
MSCFICQEPINALTKATLFCACDGTEMGNVHESCADTWEKSSGYRCALRCGNPHPPMHVLVKIISTYFLGSSFFIFSLSQNELHTFCGLVHLAAVCYLWLV